MFLKAHYIPRAGITGCMLGRALHARVSTVDGLGHYPVQQEKTADGKCAVSMEHFRGPNVNFSLISRVRKEIGRRPAVLRCR